MKAKRSEVLHLDYVTIKGHFIMENGVAILAESVVDKKPSEIKAIYEQASKGKLYDYQYALSSGFIRAKRDIAKEVQVRQEQLEEDAKRIAEIPVKPKQEFSIILAIRLVMLFVGVGAMSMSIFYNQEALRDYLPPFFAVVLSITMIVFSTMAFEASVLFHNRHMNLFSCMFAVLWLVVTIYSMFSIMSVNFTNYHAKEAVALAENKDVNSGRLQLASIASKKVIQNDQINSQKAKIEEYKTREKQNSWTLAQYESELKKLQAGLIALIDAELVIQKETPDSVLSTDLKRETFFEYFGKLLRVSPALLQFLLSTLPALFIDLIAPFSVAIAIFLGKEGEENGKEKRNS